LTFEEDTNSTIFNIYAHLIKLGKPAGPREVMNALNLSSPAVAHRGLQKLVDLGIVEKDAYGQYSAKEKVSFKGYFWFGKNLIPKFILFGLFFGGLLVPEVAALIVRWSFQEPIEPYVVMVVTTSFSAIAFLIEGFRLKRKMGE
jgi:hypothetical protein